MCVRCMRECVCIGVCVPTMADIIHDITIDLSYGVVLLSFHVIVMLLCDALLYCHTGALYYVM